ncbi:MAG: hypothetical protein AB3N28_09540 [Kordiimonas sp.]
MRLEQSYQEKGSRKRAKVAVVSAAERRAANLRLYAINVSLLLSLLLLLGAGRLIGP